jgi:predicted nucleic acid-binding protein
MPSHAMVLDTNIIIAYLDNEDCVVSTIHTLFQTGTLLLIPAVVHTELLSFSGFSEKEVRNTDAFLIENFVFVHIDQRISRIAAEIRRTVRIQTPDAYIAATALAYNVPLITRNVRDFTRVPHLQVETL